MADTHEAAVALNRLATMYHVAAEAHEMDEAHEIGCAMERIFKTIPDRDEERAMSSWISVADRLPETPHEDNGWYSDEVAVLTDEGKIRPAWYVAAGDGEPAMWRDEFQYDIDVIAWMPYPDEAEMARLNERAKR